MIISIKLPSIGQMQPANFNASRTAEPEQGELK
jgi:hypothetical protein